MEKIGGRKIKKWLREMNILSDEGLETNEETFFEFFADIRGGKIVIMNPKKRKDALRIFANIDISDSMDIFQDSKNAANMLRSELNRFGVDFKFNEEVPTKINIRRIVYADGLSKQKLHESMSEISRAVSQVKFFLKTQGDLAEGLK